jgi:hypothetical protein
MKKVTLSHIELNQLEIELVQYFNMHLLNDTTAMDGIEETFKRLRQKME